MISVTSPDWLRPLPEPVELEDGTQLVTLRDAATYVLGLPPERKDRRSWRIAATAMMAAARGGDLREVVVSIKLALILDR